MAAKIPYFTLNNGVKIPSVGLGCFIDFEGGGDRGEHMVKLAIKNGYRHFDTAYAYKNEEYVGKGILESGVPREELFVTTKLMNNFHDRVREGFDTSLKSLGLDYIDLYLMHWPMATDENGNAPAVDESPTFIETWREMEKLLDTGKVRTIGVSNFSIKLLEELLPHVKIVPAVNQVEVNPCLPQLELQSYCDRKGIHLTAYSPFGQPVGGPSSVPLFGDADLKAVAERHGASVGQVVLSWCVQRGVSVIPKSEREERLRANISLIRLSDADMALVSAFHKKPGMHRSLLSRYHSGGSFLGWTYAQLGWDMNKDGTVVKGF